MKASFILAGVILVYVVLGYIAVETGMTAPVVDFAPPDAPSGGGSLWDKISAVLAPLAWAFNAIASLFQLATFQGEDVPPLVNGLIFAPLGFIMVIVGIKIARGSST